MLKFLAEKISTHLLSKLAVAMTPALATVAIYFRTEITTQIEQTSPQTLAIIRVVLALGGLALFAGVLYLLPSFKYDPKLQVYRHRITDLLYCPPCRNKKPLSPLKREVSGWRCPFNGCGKFYRDPDYKEPPKPPPAEKSIYRR